MPNNRYSELWLKTKGEEAILFCFKDKMRLDSHEVVQWFKDNKMNVVMLSGDRKDVVVEAAEELGITNYEYACKPQHKIEIIEKLKSEGS